MILHAPQAVNWGVARQRLALGHTAAAAEPPAVTDRDIDFFHGSQKLAVIRYFVDFFFSDNALSDPHSQSRARATVAVLGEATRATLVKEIDEYLEESLSAAYFDNSQSSISLVRPEVLPTWFTQLRGHGVRVCLNTGYSKSIQGALVRKLGLESLVDGFISSSEVPRGRPSPFMVHSLMQRQGVEDVRAVAKIGDTVNDILEGKNAGCGLVIGVLSGADSAEKLLAAGADLIVSDCTQIAF